MTHIRVFGMPRITIRGTMPTFFKIPVTTELARAVQLEKYPIQETVAHAHITAVPRPARRYDQDMMSLDNRRIALSCFEAFKAYL